MKQKALLMTLSSKLKDKEMILLDKIELTKRKTKLMVEIINDLKTKLKKNLNKSVLIVLPKTDLKISQSVKNIPKIKTIRADSLNVLDILTHQYLLILQDSIKVIEKTYLK